jgi:hypothetical protein
MIVQKTESSIKAKVRFAVAVAALATAVGGLSAVSAAPVSYGASQVQLQAG